MWRVKSCRAQRQGDGCCKVRGPNRCSGCQGISDPVRASPPRLGQVNIQPRHLSHSNPSVVLVYPTSIEFISLTAYDVVSNVCQTLYPGTETWPQGIMQRMSFPAHAEAVSLYGAAVARQQSATQSATRSATRSAAQADDDGDGVMQAVAITIVVAVAVAIAIAGSRR